jgi:outer membrane protein assembly factor BamB
MSQKLTMRERLIVPAYLLAAIFFTGTCPTRATAEDWVQFRHDLSNTGKSGETTISSANVASLKVKWKTYFGGTGSTPAVVTVNGTSTVFIPTNTGAIYAINAVTGAVIWNQQLPSSVTEVYSSPAVANNILYIGANDGRLYAMNAPPMQSFGATRPVRRPIQKCTPSPLFITAWSIFGIASQDDLNYCVAGHIVALNASTGAKVWDIQTAPAGTQERASGPRRRSTPPMAYSTLAAATPGLHAARLRPCPWPTASSP